MALSSSLVSLGILVGIYSLLALGLNIKYGYTGLLEIGHVAFFLIGAHVTALLMLPPAEERALVEYVLGWGWSWFPSVLVAAVVAGLVGGFVALPAVRLREDYLAVAVLGFSVILQFVVRNERWLANGTDGLYGIGRPFGGLFPMPASTASVEAAVVLGATVGVLWAAAACAVVRVNARSEVGRFTNAALYVSTFGAGYAARRFGGDGTTKESVRASSAAGAVAGVVAAIGSLVGAQHFVILVFFGGFSAFTWAFAASVLSHHYGDLTRVDFSTGVGLAVGLVVALSPLVALGGRSVGLSLAAVLLVALVYGTYELARRWDRETSFVRVVGVAAVTLFFLRYFVVEGLRMRVRGGASRVVTETTENILWMLRFDASTLSGLFSQGSFEVGYSRFLLVLTFAFVAGSYYLVEMTVRSPFGRVLKAVREDEDVANALGKNVFSYKVQSMVLGSALAGAAGGLFAIYLRSFSYSDFAPEVTFIVFLIVILGGTANNAGVVLGSALYWGFERATQDIAGFFPAEQATQVAALRRALIGVLLILVLYYMPQGVWKERKGTYGEEKEVPQ